MSMIDYLESREVLDFNGNPTIEVDCYLEDGSFGRAIAPCIKDVSKALKFVGSTLDSELEGMDSLDQISVDNAMENLKQKGEYGALMAVSVAVARAGADFLGISLKEHLGSFHSNALPVPVFVFQDKAQIPLNALSFSQALGILRAKTDLKEVKTDKFDVKVFELSNFKTVSELYEAVNNEIKKGRKTALSDISTPTEDSMTADLCVALSINAVLLSPQRMPVLNELVRLEEELDSSASFQNL